MTKADIVKNISDQTGMDKTDVQMIAEKFMDEIKSSLQNNNNVYLRGEQLCAGFEELSKKAWDIITEIEELGGMTKAVKAGIPKLKIEESATKKQAKVDSGSRVVVGVNKYKNPKEPSVDVRVIDNNRVRDDQIKKIQAIKESRDTTAVEKALANLTNAAKDFDKAFKENTKRQVPLEAKVNNKEFKNISI